MDNQGTVYLLHFDPPYKHARHYIGYADNLDARLQHHANGTGARLCQVVVLAGARLVLARTWAGDRGLERQLKKPEVSTETVPDM